MRNNKGQWHNPITGKFEETTSLLYDIVEGIGIVAFITLFILIAIKLQ